jgi:hypothetical protein
VVSALGTRHALIFIAGYPPADHGVRDYLTSPSSKDVAYDRASAFLEALFDHTANTLQTILCFDPGDSPKYVDYAREFRSRMTEGQKMTGHNKFREELYKVVVEKAKQLEAKRVGDSLVRRYLCLRCLARHRL